MPEIKAYSNRKRLASLARIMKVESKKVDTEAQEGLARRVHACEEILNRGEQLINVATTCNNMLVSAIKTRDYYGLEEAISFTSEYLQNGLCMNLDKTFKAEDLDDEIRSFLSETSASIFENIDRASTLIRLLDEEEAALHDLLIAIDARDKDMLETSLKSCHNVNLSESNNEIVGDGTRLYKRIVQSKTLSKEMESLLGV